MSEYMTAFEMEIVAEGFIDKIVEKTKMIFETVRKLIKACIDFLTKLIMKLRKRRKGQATNKDETPGYQSEGDSRTMSGNIVADNNDTGKASTDDVIYKADTYDCGKELNEILADLNFCMSMITKRQYPNHKTNKSYADRWRQDNELIVERMAKCANVLDKLEGIENRTIELEAAEKLKTQFEELDKIYDACARKYSMFSKMNPATDSFMAETQIAITAIADVAGRAAKLNLTLMNIKED